MSHFRYSFDLYVLRGLVDSFPTLGFSGSRFSGSAAAASCQSFLSAIDSFSGSVGVGCARGVDALIRTRFTDAVIFRVQPPLSRRAFAVRSARLVHWLVAQGGLLVVFPVAACPLGVRPSVSFRGYGSGSWGTAALALGLGVPVLLVLPAAVCSIGVALPAPTVMAARFSCMGLAPCGGTLWLTD